MTQKNSSLHLAFSTPIWIYKLTNYQDLNDKMYKYIKNIQSNDPEGITKSNLNGWHSKNFDLTNDEPKFFVNSISSNLSSLCQDMGWDIEKQKIDITAMWSIINKKHASNQRHIHSNNHVSAAYYVKAPKNCGDIKFYDPRSAAVYFTPKHKSPTNLNANTFTIIPEEGLLVLFPGYLHHSVNINNSDEERVIISFNFKLT